MVSSKSNRSFTRGIERSVIAVLIGLAALTLFFTMLLGPGLLPIVFMLALAALGVQQLLQHDRQQTAIHDAIALGAPEPIAAWGKIAEVVGDCPDGQTLRKGTTFVVADGRVWPSLCQHADRAVLDALG